MENAKQSNHEESRGGGLTGSNLTLRYDRDQPLVVNGQSLQIRPGKINALIGPNGSGKSTLLKALARQLAPDSGQVILDGQDIAKLPARELARNLGMLFQERTAPGDLTVEELVYHGRYPHRKLFEPPRPEDDTAVVSALYLSGITDLRRRPLGELSGGQKQLAWIAMAVAQSPRYLLLDEPTTFLDLAHQFDVMDLLLRLNREFGKTIVLVVHDINLAARYADYLFAMRDGKITAEGAPAAVLTEETLRRVFDVETRVIEQAGTLFWVPIGRSGRGF